MSVFECDFYVFCVLYVFLYLSSIVYVLCSNLTLKSWVFTNEDQFSNLLHYNLIFSLKMKSARFVCIIPTFVCLHKCLYSHKICDSLIRYSTKLFESQKYMLAYIQILLPCETGILLYMQWCQLCLFIAEPSSGTVCCQESIPNQPQTLEKKMVHPNPG